MILLSFFTTVEFFVILAVVAAAVAIAAAMPSRRGQAREFRYTTELLNSYVEDPVPMLQAEYHPNGMLTLFRTGLKGLTQSGSINLEVTIIGTDVTLVERRDNGFSGDPACDSAIAYLDCLGRLRYHFHYIAADNRQAAFTLNLRPGNRTERPLQ